MDREIGAYAAKTRLPELLREVERGDRITITVRGRAVAKLVPVDDAPADRAKALAAMERFEGVHGVDGETVLGWISEGRR